MIERWTGSAASIAPLAVLPTQKGILSGNSHERPVSHGHVAGKDSDAPGVAFSGREAVERVLEIPDVVHVVLKQWTAPAAAGHCVR
jgi:hypothetical protein